ncbi:AbrB/MazE/SpoVT family DNA-binding domain-containing protein [Georgenia sp. H159]|uniref:AbrB/MazE/SpoVT family DNA-binding domain-containing protein n=1 Tax=Georgenia sp. H159 TaxID=3076115 RepID=UPI002D768B03|nr:AbrB/MazE/SpoVT family DNA-binding domain-containing protein [Georgenia sp. H159]
MRTAIDAAGRIVVPKAVRDAMGLAAGRAIDVVCTDGRIEIEPAPADVVTEVEDGLPRLRPRDRLEQLTDERVRAVLEATRR